MKCNVGIYGISGSGKTTLIKTLSQDFSIFQYFEGSKIIEDILQDDISKFKFLDNDTKYKIREKVIQKIQKRNCKKNILIDGHYSFINNQSFEIALTKADVNFFTHIFYLDVDCETIKKQQENDQSKKRDYSIENIKKWKEFEKTKLKEICENNSINYHILTTNNLDVNINYILETVNRTQFMSDLKHYVNSQKSDKYILFDADKTIINFDTGKDFIYKILGIDTKNVKECFKENGYCFSSFTKLSKIHSTVDNQVFINTMKDVASKIEIEDEFLDLLKTFHKDYNISIVTAGFSILWQEVLKKYNLNNIKVFGGNNFNIDDYIIDNNLKALIAKYLRNNNKYVVSFGDSLLDTDMLINSNRGYFVIRNKIRNDAIQKLSKYNHIQYLRINSLDTDKLQKTDFNQIKKELNENL